MSQIAAHKLKKVYGKRTVVHDVSFDVNSGEVVGLLGPNGAGKTTCFYMVIGLVAVDGGSVQMDTHDLTHMAIHQRAKSEREDHLDNLLNDLHIEHLREATAVSLSGGERRRVEIARALAINPRFILLDEPFAGVDPIAVIDIQKLVHFLVERDIGVLITDHNVRETLGICDRAYIINEGRVLISGAPELIIQDDNARKVYLGENFRL
ncbi:MAG: ABC transporter ATP-binding protein [Hydrogenophilales bacterium 16-61-112]|nr:MAG: ABC transporter ATP-binding protein [Hydrogenophilales bacterium 16-61-112]